MVQMLVMAGANIDARVTIGHKDPAIAHLLYKSTPLEGAEACKEILQILVGELGPFLHLYNLMLPGTDCYPGCRRAQLGKTSYKSWPLPPKTP